MQPRPDGSERSRPLCAYPKAARYANGDTRTGRRVFCASEAAQRCSLTMSRQRPERRCRCA